MVGRRTGAKQRDRVINHYGQDCFYCGCETVIGNGADPDHPPNLFTVDHFIPIAKGGDNTLENLRPACFVCNKMKGDNLPEDFYLGDRYRSPTLGDLWPERQAQPRQS